MKCPSEKELLAFARHELPPAATTVIDSHVATCAICKRKLADLPTGGLDQALTSSNAKTKALTHDQIPPELTKLNLYTNVRILGQGGMGVVYLATHRLMGRQEVLKVVGSKLLNKPGARDRFLQEIQSAARLQHQNVVTAYGASEVDDVIIFSMEYAPGTDLFQLVKSKGPLSVELACQYAAQVALGLQHAYEMKMVHRDIKPANLMLTKINNKVLIKILDFGLAKMSSEQQIVPSGGEAEQQVDTGLTGYGKMMGTPDYVSPEQIQDAASVDIRSDIYALGCTLYFLLTGFPPFRAKSLNALLQMHCDEMPKPLNLVNQKVPSELAEIVAKMMAKKPKDRFQKPIDVAKTLKALLAPAPKLPPVVQPISIVEIEPEPMPTAPVTPPTQPLYVYTPPVPVAVTMPQGYQPAVTQPQALSPWETLPARTENETAEDDEPRRPVAWAKKKQSALALWLIVGVTSLLMLGALVAINIIIWRSNEGTLELTNIPVDAEIYVDNNRVTSWDQYQNKAEIPLKAGKHQVELRRNNAVIYSEAVDIARADKTSLAAKIKPGPPIVFAKTPQNSKGSVPVTPVNKTPSVIPKIGEPSSAPSTNPPPSNNTPNEVPKVDLVNLDAYAARNGALKDRFLKNGGGDRETELAIARGLDWLERTQHKDGSWEFDGISKDNKVAATGLAVLPFLAAGITHKSGLKHSKLVDDGLNWLMGKVQPNGGMSTSMYEHAIGCLCLCEAAGMSKDPAVLSKATAAVDFLVKAQAKDGSWGYTAGVEGDTSILGWQIQALHAAKIAGITFDETRVYGFAEKFLNSVASDGGAKYGYRQPGGTPALTAVGLLSRYLMARLPTQAALTRGMEYINQSAAQAKSVDMYFYYYAGLALNLNNYSDWKTSWNPTVRQLLLSLQTQGFSDLRANWPKDQGLMGNSCGRLGTTCLSLLTLQVYYRYVPLNQRKMDNSALPKS